MRTRASTRRVGCTELLQGWPTRRGQARGRIDSDPGDPRRLGRPLVVTPLGCPQLLVLRFHDSLADRAERFVSAGRADLVRHAARLQTDAALTGSGVLAERVTALTAALHRVVLGWRAAPGQRRRTPDDLLREHGLRLGPDGLRLAGAIA